MSFGSSTPWEDRDKIRLFNDDHETQTKKVWKHWGGRRDLNPRRPDPQSGALTRLSYDHQPNRIERDKLLTFGGSVKLAVNPCKGTPHEGVGWWMSCRPVLWTSELCPFQDRIAGAPLDHVLSRYQGDLRQGFVGGPVKICPV